MTVEQMKAEIDQAWESVEYWENVQYDRFQGWKRTGVTCVVSMQAENQSSSERIVMAPSEAEAWTKAAEFTLARKQELKELDEEIAEVESVLKTVSNSRSDYADIGDRTSERMCSDSQDRWRSILKRLQREREALSRGMRSGQ